MLGEFEYLILSAAAHLGQGAYGAAMRAFMEETAGRRCSLGALYTTLDRLEAKGLVSTWMSEPTEVRGGRARRMVQLTAQGENEAREFYEAVMRMSLGTAWSHGGPVSCDAAFGGGEA